MEGDELERAQIVLRERSLGESDVQHPPDAVIVGPQGHDRDGVQLAEIEQLVVGGRSSARNDDGTPLGDLVYVR
ncbi:MAG: hypothetical protein E6J72_05760 [Deltaproteobacteria bacterium]|nr:MAG: hypothetical protein E6J72_05760 [Deltaproteobacteria bacterium]